MALNVVFRKLERSSQTPAGRRLATVREAEENLEWIKSNNVIEEWDRVRLLDGWIGGSGYNFTVEVGYRSCLGYMLLVYSPTPEIYDTDDRDAAIYSEVPEVSEEGRSAAVLLCTEDWNEDVLNWLMGGKREGDAMREAASEVVSEIARKWQGLHAKRPQLSLASLEASRIDFQRCLNALVAETKKSLRASMINSERVMIINRILHELSSVLINGSDLTKYFEMFQNSGQENVAETVWYVAVEKVAWQTFNILSRYLYSEVVMYSDSSLQNMFRYAYDYVRQALNVVWKCVESAAKEGNGDFKRFPKFECKGITVFFGNTTTSPDVLSTFLLAAAYDADVSLVKRLMGRGIQPSVVSEENGNTVLHYAAEMMQDLDRYKIADMLLAEDANRVDAIGWEHRTALHIASKNGDDTMCTLLLKYNASLTIENSFGYTPLHMALRRSYDEVVRVLISADGEDTNKEGYCLVDIKDHSGETPLDYAIQYTNVNIVVWLLSMSRQPECYIKELQPLSLDLRESSQMGFTYLVQKMLNAGADPFEGDDQGKTALHYAAECADMTGEGADHFDSDDSYEGTEKELAWEIIQKLLFDRKEGSVNWGKASATDKYGRNILHVAAFLGRSDLCRELLRANRNLVDSKDRDGQSALYYAVAGPHDDVSVLRIILEEQGRNQVYVKDFSQTTPLHVAAAGGNLKMVGKLLAEISGEDRKNCVEAPDVLGQTALLKAASGGHVEVVEKLLEEGADPLKERDSDGKTALDFAAQADGEQAVKIAEVLLSHYKSDEKSTKQKGLLLFTSTVGIGLHPNSLLEKYLKQQNSKVKETLGPDDSLKVAATLGDIDMTLECLTRGANIALIRNEQWKKNLPTAEEKKNVQDVLKQIKTIVEQGTDKPALEDNLGGYNYLVFDEVPLPLNPFVKSPVTVGISGEWGMGKSSVMIQTESILLKTAAQLAFKNSFQKSNLLGKAESKLSVTGQGKRRKIADEIARLERRDGPQFEEQEESGSGSETNGEIPGEEDLLGGTTPSILTVRYNAWHYRNETEAWAGLAVEITKELEATMTVAHKLRTSWIYNWKNRRNNICFGVILPFFIALMVAIWFSTVVWFIFNTGENKDLKKLKYGGLPASLIVAAWGVGKSVISFVKPISSQVVDYICLPDHNQKLGYHQKVIDDINFLKESLYYKRSFKWEVFSFIWCCITWSWDENYVSRTKIPKMRPAFGHNLRMIVFVDDLDRCDENVILKVLSAVNLVLATCHINVILSMENSMIQRAILRKYGNINNRDNYRFNVELAEKYIRKIVQLPLHLPDPSEKESNNFLKRQLGMWDTIQGSTDPAAEKEIERHGAHGRRKVNPKFQIATATQDRFGEDEGREEYFEQSLKKLQRALGVSGTDIVQQRLEHEEEQIRKTMEKAGEGSGVELEAETEIHETTSDTPQDGSGAKEAKIDMDDRPYNVKTGDKQMQEGSRGKRSHMDDLSSIISAMLIPKYTPGERSAFRFLHKRCTHSRKLPREWKCLMAYHRLAWNILYLTFHQEDVNIVEGWQVQLIAWIFVCWEWRGLITILTKKWNKLEVLVKWKADEGPSLREIVEHYIGEELSADNKSANFQGDKKRATKKEDDAIDSSAKEIVNYSNSIAEVENASNTATISREEDTEEDNYLRNVLKEQKEMMEALRKAQEDMQETLRKAQEGMNEVLRKVQEDMREVLKEQEETREMLKKKVLNEDEDNEEESSQENQTRMIKKFFIEEDMEREISMQQYTEAEEREEWFKLRDSLRRYNVSMDGIQAFQKFRFYCQPGHLPWPLPIQD